MPFFAPYALLCTIFAGLCMQSVPITRHERGSHYGAGGEPTTVGMLHTMTCTPASCPYSWPTFQNLGGGATSGNNNSIGGHSVGKGAAGAFSASGPFGAQPGPSGGGHGGGR